MQLYKTNELLAESPLKTNGHLQLKIIAEGDTYSFHFAENNQWVLLKDKTDARFLSTQEAGGFLGCLFGLYVTSSGTATKNTAAFRYLYYKGEDTMYE